MPWGANTQKALSLSTQLSLNAMGLIGVPYIWGGAKTTVGLDCSGLVQSVYQQTANIALPRNTAQQAAATRVITADELRPGDLVFFNTLNRPFSHVGIYVGDNRFVHAPKPGASVRISTMTRAYWASRFDGARRAITADAKLSSLGLSNE
jgi:cell wall-associated NlpC family hydrolase